MLKKKILVIEDNPDLAWLYVHALVKRGYKALSALDGKSGMRAARAYRPDAVILDRTLPDMDGRTVCRSLRTRRIPILFVSGRSRDPECALCGACAASTLIKPVAMTKLVDELNRLISRRPKTSRTRLTRGMTAA